MNRNAFSLLHLSIVLVVLGLITGGLMAGKSLIRASELRAIPVEYGKYTTALSAFKQKYNALPGDMPNAIDYWGAAPDPCISTVGTGTQTCNGNGDAEIKYQVASDETLRAWQHMANAGLIEGKYDGVHYTAAGMPMSGVGANAAWNLYKSTDIWHVIGLFGIPGNSAYLSPGEAYSIDVKSDDGIPGSGQIRGYAGSDTPAGCISGTSYATATGQLECGIYYLIVP